MANTSFSSIPSDADVNMLITLARNFFDMDDELDDDTLWESLTNKFAGNSTEEILEYCSASIMDYEAALLGLLPALNHTNDDVPCESYDMQEPPPIIATDPLTRELIAKLREGLPEQGTTKGTLWSKEEHSLFLLGMKFCGRGDWKNISKYFVLSRTSTQIASHAQKFFTRRIKQRQQQNINEVNSMTQAQYLPTYMQDGCYERNTLGLNQQVMMPMPSNIYQPLTPPMMPMPSNICQPLTPPPTPQQFLMCYPNTGALAVWNRNEFGGL